jgi:phage head maturation protease
MSVLLDTIRGVAAVYNEASEPYYSAAGKPYRRVFAASSLRIGANVVLDVEHERQVQLASTAARSLRVWRTPAGIAFEADIVADRRGAGIRDMLRSGLWRSSIAWSGESSDWTRAGDEDVEVISAALLQSVSVCRRPAFANTACWLASVPVGDLPPFYQRRAEEWARRIDDRRIVRSAPVAHAIAARTAREKQGKALFDPATIRALARASGMPA